MWTAFINTISADSLPDLVLTIIVLVAFAIGFFLGMVGFGRMAGVILLGVLSGFSIGLRIVLLRPGLLIPRYVANWLLLVVFMIIGLALIFFRQRMGLVSSAGRVSSCGQ